MKKKLNKLKDVTCLIQQKNNFKKFNLHFIKTESFL